MYYLQIIEKIKIPKGPEKPENLSKSLTAVSVKSWIIVATKQNIQLL